MIILNVNCASWRKGDKPGGGTCVKGLQNSHPSIGWCATRCAPLDHQPIDKSASRIIVEKLLENPAPAAASTSDWERKGPPLWGELHQWALGEDATTNSAWLQTFEMKIGCNSCRSRWQQWIADNPPDFSSNQRLFFWTVAAHNAVNLSLGKPEMATSIALARWSRGMIDVDRDSVGEKPPENDIAANESFEQKSDPATLNCRSASFVPQTPYIRCSLGLFGGTPHLSICRQCAKRRPRESDDPGLASTEDGARESNHASSISRDEKYDGRLLLLRSFLSPGDILMMTAAVRDLHRQFPNRFATAVQTSVPELWENNPYISEVDQSAGSWRTIDLHYPLINQSNQRPMHFIQGYADYLASELNVTFPITEFKGDIHLTEEEKNWTNQVRESFGHAGRFWIMMAGGKYDFTTKWWPTRFYQQVVDHFLGRIQFVQCGQSGHWHPPLKGVFNLVGKTSTRQFIRLVHHAEGVVCPVTFAMHLCAAVPTRTSRLRPCVVIAGGREPSHWESYPGHQFLHTIGSLPCCATGGCWKSRCQTVDDDDSKNREGLCDRPVQIEPDLRVPQCMVMVRPVDVISAIERSLTFFE
jgi:ADP-heptose:LPS heptosyltransferase